MQGQREEWVVTGGWEEANWEEHITHLAQTYPKSDWSFRKEMYIMFFYQRSSNLREERLAGKAPVSDFKFNFSHVLVITSCSDFFIHEFTLQWLIIKI